MYLPAQFIPNPIKHTSMSSSTLRCMVETQLNIADTGEGKSPRTLFTPQRKQDRLESFGQSPWVINQRQFTVN